MMSLKQMGLRRESEIFRNDNWRYGGAAVHLRRLVVSMDNEGIVTDSHEGRRYEGSYC